MCMALAFHHLLCWYLAGLWQLWELGRVQWRTSWTERGGRRMGNLCPNTSLEPFLGLLALLLFLLNWGLLSFCTARPL